MASWLSFLQRRLQRHRRRRKSSLHGLGCQRSDASEQAFLPSQSIEDCHRHLTQRVRTVVSGNQHDSIIAQMREALAGAGR